MKILDVCCGSRMFYFDHENPDVTYCDNRVVNEVLRWGHKINVNPDIVADFRNLPFADNSYNVVVFDPPHLVNAGDNSWLVKKYGRLNRDTWKEDIAKGFKECLRVLKVGGTLIFKWSDAQVKLQDVLKLAPQQPLLGDRGRNRSWVVFVKGDL